MALLGRVGCSGHGDPSADHDGPTAPGAATFFLVGLRSFSAPFPELRGAVTEPRFAVMADTAWLQYGAQHTLLARWHAHVFRFERRCGTWRIALLTTLEPGRSPRP